jgi:hypothetical protein
MNISDSVLRAQLDNVLWIGGAACGGKTTLTDALATKHGLLAYHPEDHFQQHKELACEQDHPTMLRAFLGWEWFFNRPMDEYASAIVDTDRELIEMVVLDAIKLSETTTVVVDAHMLAPGVAKQIMAPAKVIFLFADQTTLREGFFAREDKQDVLGIINTLTDPAKTREHVLDVACEVSARKLDQVKASGLRYVIRDGTSTVEDTLGLVEEHFGLS